MLIFVSDGENEKRLHVFKDHSFVFYIRSDKDDDDDI